MSRKRQRLTQHFLIDRQYPVAKQADLSHGEVIAAMVANRLAGSRSLSDGTPEDSDQRFT